MTSPIMIVMFQRCIMGELFDRYFLVIAGRVPEADCGAVASASAAAGGVTLGWPLDFPDEPAANETADDEPDSVRRLRSLRDLASA